MNWAFEFLKPQKILRVTTGGQFFLENQAQMFEEIAGLDEWSAGMPILFDNRRLEMKNVDAAIIKRSVVILQNFNRLHSASRMAGLVNRDINFGFGRQFEIIADIDGESHFRLFHDETMALKWLGGEDDDEPKGLTLIY